MSFKLSLQNELTHPPLPSYPAVSPCACLHPVQAREMTMQELCSNVHLLDRGSPTPLTVLDARSQQCQLKARPSCVVQCQCRVSLVYHADSWLQLGPQFTEQYYLQGRMRHRWSHEFTASHSIPVLISLTNVHFLSWPGYTVAGLLSAILSSHVFLYLLLPARMRDNTNGAVFFFKCDIA